MIKINSVSLNKNTVGVRETFIIEVGLTEVFPTWQNAKNNTWQDYRKFTWQQAKDLIVEEME